MPSHHVIIIDDDSAACASVCALLEAFGYDVTSFHSAEAFLSADDAATNDACLLLDMQLPGMNGRELQKKLKRSGIQLPVIFVSGYADSALTSEAVEDGAIAVLEKPVNPHLLVEHVERALSHIERG